MLLEICIDNLESAWAAIRGGADRLEVCSDLYLDGLTPDMALIPAIQSESNIPLMAMVRPRPGDFCYTAAEIQLMKTQIREFQSMGVRGIVLGCLHGQTIDTDVLNDLSQVATGMDITFHRAFDQVSDPLVSLEQLIVSNIPRILTSGLAPTAWEGRGVLKQLVQQAGDRITILAGAGIGPANAKDILAYTSVKEIHGSAAEKVLPRTGSHDCAAYHTREDWVREMKAAFEQPG